ncbi:hypothetical protein AB0H00_30110 [Nocardia sp. NPDC023852]
MLAAATQAFIMAHRAWRHLPMVLAVLFARMAYQRRDGIVALREILFR